MPGRCRLLSLALTSSPTASGPRLRPRSPEAGTPVTDDAEKHAREMFDVLSALPDAAASGWGLGVSVSFDGRGWC